jgi:endonuclease VIII
VPEGDTVVRAATRLREALEGRRISRIRSFFPAIENAGLAGRKVERIETHGKHLFVHFDDGRALHTHLGMRGSWRIYPAGRAVRTTGPALRLLLQTNENVVALWNAPVVELVRGGARASQPVVKELGPDLLAAEFDVAEAVARLRAHDSRPLGEVLLDQRALSGIGNVFKSEVLFLCGIDPFSPVSAFGDQALESVITTARREMRRSTAAGRRFTRRAVDGPRVWVYKRGNQLCLRCGAAILMRHQGVPPRSTYFCPACQGVKLPSVG